MISERIRTLDITEYLCPMTFVKAKLFLESCVPNQIVDILLHSGEPLDNLPLALEADGHHILAIESQDASGSIYMLKVKVANSL